jgi:hypothetical protein
MAVVHGDGTKQSRTQYITLSENRYWLCVLGFQILIHGCTFRGSIYPIVVPVGFHIPTKNLKMCWGVKYPDTDVYVGFPILLLLHRNITEEYQRGCDLFSRKEKALFKTSLPTLLNSSTASKQLWLQRVQVARQHQESVAREGELVYTQERQRIRDWIRTRR